MAQGVDLEAAEPYQYHAILADPRDDEEPVWGYAPSGRGRGCCSAAFSRMSDEGRDFVLVVIVSCFLTALMLGPYYYAQYSNLPSFSVRLTGYDGIDPGRPGRVVSPAFNVTLSLNKTCVDRAEVTVLYSGVALGWARVEPRDCTGKRWAKDVEVVARGAGVGLSRLLRDRMASEWRSSGTVELDVDVEIFNDGSGRRVGSDIPEKVMLCKVRTDGRESESSPCSWYVLSLHRYD